MLPLLLLTCHCTVGVGVPLAAAVKVTGWPAGTVSLLGLVVTLGALERDLVVPTGAVSTSVAVAVALAIVALLGLARFTEKTSLARPAAFIPATLTVMVWLVCPGGKPTVPVIGGKVRVGLGGAGDRRVGDRDRVGRGLRER